MRVTIEKLDHFGRGVCHIGDKVCFVAGALPDEVVLIDILKENKKFFEAKTNQIIEESSFRVSPLCPYYKQCGGCSLQHMSFDYENIFKENKVKEILERFGNVSCDKVLPLVFHDEYHYRNKITLHGNGEKMGLYGMNSHDIVPIDNCLLVLPIINDFISRAPNVSEFIIKCSNDGKDILTSSHNNQLLMKIGECSYYQSISSFFQVNHTLTKELYDEVLRFVMKIKPNRVLDLYCGTGTIGIYVSKYCDQIIGIDYSESNIFDAKKNAELNHVTNIEFICDKVENKIDSFQNIDFVIVDPPRSGLDSKTKRVLQQIFPHYIVYVSCDPVTLARDLKDLNQIYDVISVKPFNMFPRTHHVECVCLLCRRN